MTVTPFMKREQLADKRKISNAKYALDYLEGIINNEKIESIDLNVSAESAFLFGIQERYKIIEILVQSIDNPMNPYHFQQSLRVLPTLGKVYFNLVHDIIAVDPSYRIGSVVDKCCTTVRKLKDQLYLRDNKIDTKVQYQIERAIRVIINRIHQKIKYHQSEALG